MQELDSGEALTVIAIDGKKLRDATGSDPEFRLVARRWSARIRLRMDDAARILTIADGTLAEVNDAPTFWDPWDIDISAPAAAWEKLLAPVPRPMYQDIFPANLHGDFRIGGNLELLFGHYPAARRLIEILRAQAAQGTR